MNLQDYQEESQRTFSYRKEPLSQEQTDLLHCAIGASTEANELLDAFKKHIYYGKPLDVVNVGEEIADQMWYNSNLCRLLKLDMEVLLQNNINKLKVRYPEKFTNELAENRNLAAEYEKLKVAKTIFTVITETTSVPLNTYVLAINEDNALVGVMVFNTVTNSWYCESEHKILPDIKKFVLLETLDKM